MTIIFEDEIMIEEFETQEGAMKTVTSMRDLFEKKLNDKRNGKRNTIVCYI